MFKNDRKDAAVDDARERGGRHGAGEERAAPDAVDERERGRVPRQVGERVVDGDVVDVADPRVRHDDRDPRAQAVVPEKQAPEREREEEEDVPVER